MSCNNCLNIPCCCSNYTTTTTTIPCDDPQCNAVYTTDCVAYTGTLGHCLGITTEPVTVTEILETILSQSMCFTYYDTFYPETNSLLLTSTIASSGVYNDHPYWTLPIIPTVTNLESTEAFVFWNNSTGWVYTLTLTNIFYDDVLNYPFDEVPLLPYTTCNNPGYEGCWNNELITVSSPGVCPTVSTLQEPMMLEARVSIKTMCYQINELEVGQPITYIDADNNTITETVGNKTVCAKLGSLNVNTYYLNSGVIVPLFTRCTECS